MGCQTETSEVSFTNRVRDTKDKIPDAEDKVEEMKTLNLKIRNPGTKFPGNLGYCEKTNLRIIGREEGNPGQKHGKLFKQTYRRKIPPNKEGGVYQGTRSIQNSK